MGNLITTIIYVSLGYWQFNSKSEEIHFIHVSQRHSGNDDEENGFDLPRFVVNESILTLFH